LNQLTVSGHDNLTAEGLELRALVSVLLSVSMVDNEFEKCRQTGDNCVLHVAYPLIVRRSYWQSITNVRWVKVG